MEKNKKLIIFGLMLAMVVSFMLPAVSGSAQNDDEEGTNTTEVLIFLLVVIIFVSIAVLMSGVRIVQPYQQALLTVLGTYKRILNPGFHIIVPLISKTLLLDMRTQVIDVPRQEVITKDNSPTNVDAVIYIKVIDPYRAAFEVTNFKVATVALAQTSLRSQIGDMELDEILYNRERINTTLRDILDEATDAWGVKVENVEIREVDPIARVKQAMEEQTSAERERRAAILRADGEKRAAILSAEGLKRSRILKAEGLRQSKILEAEGERQAIILNKQGEAQGLRILAMGAAPLDQKGLTVLSLDALKRMSEGKATKIIFPFEISKLLEGASEYIGATRGIPEREISSIEDLEKALGKADEILGTIPRHDELQKEIEEIDKEMKKEAEETEEIAKIAERGKIPEVKNEDIEMSE